MIPLMRSVTVLEGGDSGARRGKQALERIPHEIRQRSRVVGAFPNAQSALNLAAARLRHIVGPAWSTKRDLTSSC
jgi:hypothetical protein